MVDSHTKFALENAHSAIWCPRCAFPIHEKEKNYIFGVRQQKKIATFFHYNVIY